MLDNSTADVNLKLPTCESSDASAASIAETDGDEPIYAPRLPDSIKGGLSSFHFGPGADPVKRAMQVAALDLKSPIASHVLLVLSCYVDKDGKNAFPSLRTLVSKTGLQKSAIGNAMKLLVKGGFVQEIRRGGRGSTVRSVGIFDDRLIAELMAWTQSVSGKSSVRRGGHKAGNVLEFPSQCPPRRTQVVSCPPGRDIPVVVFVEKKINTGGRERPEGGFEVEGKAEFAEAPLDGQFAARLLLAHQRFPAEGIHPSGFTRENAASAIAGHRNALLLQGHADAAITVILDKGLTALEGASGQGQHPSASLRYLETAITGVATKVQTAPTAASVRAAAEKEAEGQRKIAEARLKEELETITAAGRLKRDHDAKRSEIILDGNRKIGERMAAEAASSTRKAPAKAEANTGAPRQTTNQRACAAAKAAGADARIIDALGEVLLRKDTNAAAKGKEVDYLLGVSEGLLTIGTISDTALSVAAAKISKEGDWRPSVAGVLRGVKSIVWHDGHWTNLLGRVALVIEDYHHFKANPETYEHKDYCGKVTTRTKCPLVLVWDKAREGGYGADMEAFSIKRHWSGDKWENFEVFEKTLKHHLAGQTVADRLMLVTCEWKEEKAEKPKS
jgi:hypothetical protein